MNCYYHPDRPSVAVCVVCGKNLCTECSIIKEGQSYCRECLGIREVPVEIGKIFVPALACGALAGVLSIIPVISALNCFFCLWIIIGGALAVYLLKRFNNIKGKISLGKAVLTGGLSGFVASLFMIAFVFLLQDLGTLMEEAMRSPEVQQAFEDAGMAAGDVTGLILVFAAIVFPILFTLFGALGGIISNELTK